MLHRPAGGNGRRVPRAARPREGNHFTSLGAVGHARRHREYRENWRDSVRQDRRFANTIALRWHLGAATPSDAASNLQPARHKPITPAANTAARPVTDTVRCGRCRRFPLRKCQFVNVKQNHCRSRANGNPEAQRAGCPLPDQVEDKLRGHHRFHGSRWR